jgi:molybdenum cofactor biosynthesis enzyme
MPTNFNLKDRRRKTSHIKNVHHGEKNDTIHAAATATTAAATDMLSFSPVCNYSSVSVNVNVSVSVSVNVFVVDI